MSFVSIKSSLPKEPRRVANELRRELYETKGLEVKRVENQEVREVERTPAKRRNRVPDKVARKLSQLKSRSAKQECRRSGGSVGEVVRRRCWGGFGLVVDGVQSVQVKE